MKIEKFKPMASPKQRNKEPLLLTGWGDGCGEGDCHCSDGYWLSLSDGNAGLLVIFDDEREMMEMLRARLSRDEHRTR